MTFEGYSSEAFDFLEALPSRDPDWFKANKSEYQRLIVEPTKALVVDLGQDLQAKEPNIEAQPKTNGSIAPINNDLRFSPDAAPYRDHLMLRFWEGSPKKTAPTLMVHIGTDKVGFAAGFVPADVGRWREVVDSDDGEALAREVAKLTKAKKAEVFGQELKKVPSPYPADHPRADLLRHKALQVRWIEPMPASVSKPSFVGWVGKRLDAALPLHRVLVSAFG
ncbi:MAG: DUF2461 domain-containing protein [Acidimicrobiia bacterium]|nr:DUF2461 domain-containing protein [Acidimicrobiia bacterium]